MIVVAGEALVDLVTGEDGAPTAYPGGSPLNVAVGLGRLGLEVTLLTEYADDPYGALLRDHLKRSGVIVDASPTERTSTAAADLSGADPVYELEVSWGLPALGLPGCAALHVGSLGVLTAPGRDGVAHLVGQAIADGCFLSYDLNLRSGDLDQVATAHLHETAAAAHLVKLSAEDAALLAPGVAIDDVAQSFLGERTRLVVLTRGAEGATAYTARAEVSVPAPAVAVVDTIGAGDAFTAGLLAALAVDDFALPWNRNDLAGKLDAAAQVAALSCTRRGADLPWRADLPTPWPAAPR